MKGEERLHDLLDQAASDAEGRSAVRDAEGSWTYGELREYSHALAGWLRDQGISHGDRFLAQLRNRRETVACLFAASRLGAVMVPVAPEARAYQVLRIAASCRPRLALADEDRPGITSDVLGVPVQQVGQGWPEVERHRRTSQRTSGRSPAPTDVAVLLYTSGSTAEPKGIVCPHAQMVFAAKAIDQVLRYRREDVVFNRLPFAWDPGLYQALLACLGRSELVLADSESDLRLLAWMTETRTTIVPILPSLATMILGLARRSSAPLPAVRMFTNTGAKLPWPTIERLRGTFPGAVVVRQFGLTECKRVSIMPPDEQAERPASVGLPLPGTNVAILADDGAPCAPGQNGQIVVTGPHVMSGYWNAPEDTARTFRRDPATEEVRLYTGDYGSLDADGYLYFEGRRDDLFKRKGIRTSTLEVEAAALDVPGVVSAVALPPSEERDLTLFVVGEITAVQVLRELAERLQPAKVPGVCHVVERIPQTTNGKPARHELSAMTSLPTRGDEG